MEKKTLVESRKTMGAVDGAEKVWDRLATAEAWLFIIFSFFSFVVSAMFLDNLSHTRSKEWKATAKVLVAFFMLFALALLCIFAAVAYRALKKKKGFGSILSGFPQASSSVKVEPAATTMQFDDFPAFA